MGYSLTTLWYERQRYFPAILAVGFSSLLGCLQFGLLLGLFAIVSIPIDNSRADIWLGAPQALSVDLGRPIRESQAVDRLASNPEVDRCETYLQGFAYWAKPNGGMELCMVMGCRLDDSSLGRIKQLTPELHHQLTEPGSIVVDESDLARLGLKQVGDTAEIVGNRVRVVGLTKGVKSLAGPYVMCSVTTARSLLRLMPEQITYVLGKCHDRADAAKVVARLRAQHGTDISVFAADEFSFRSRWHWLTKTKAGFALGYAAVLGLLVGAVVTSQTLYAATAASLREFAVLRAMGIPRWRMSVMVMVQASWVGVVGVLLSFPAIYGLSKVADIYGVQVLLDWRMVASVSGITLVMAVLSGLYALRSLKYVEPALLLR